MFKICPFISIVVPVYNVEKYLPECIDSVIKQEFCDFELILVNDGSLDNCPKICDQYALIDNRIRVVHKINGGLSDARNAGLKIAEGKYIAFLDSDDILTDNSLQKVYKVLLNSNQPDLLIGTFISMFSSKDKLLNDMQPIYSMTYGVFSKVILSEFLKENNEIPWAAWRNIYSNNLIKSHKLCFEKGLVGAEDCDFFMQYIKYVKKFAITNTPIIYYRVFREGSITNSIKYEAIVGQLKVFSKYFYEYSDNNIELYGKRNINSYFANKFVNVISTFHYLSNYDEILKVEELVNNNAMILKYTNGGKYFVSKIFWKLFGYYRGSQMMHAIRKRIKI